MSEYEFVDEDGNPIDPSELGDGYEIVDDVEPEQVEAVDYLDEILLDHDADDEVPELGLDGGEQSVTVVADDEPETVEIVEEVDDEPAPAAPSLDKDAPVVEAPVEPGADSPALMLNRRAKLALVGGAAAVVLLVGGGIAFALNGIGGQNTVDDVKAGAQSKYAQASEKVVSKSSEVRGEAASVAIDTCRTGKLAGPGGLGDAMSDGTQTPKLKLEVVSSVPLPGAFIAARTNADGKAGAPSLLQLTKSGWAAYTTVPLTRAEQKAKVDKPGFWKADVTVTDDSVRVTGDRIWAGGDTGGPGSCEPGEPGVYAASGRVPADAAGLVDGTASIDAIQGVAGQSDRAVAIMGNSVVLLKLVENTAGGGDAASSSSIVPSK